VALFDGQILVIGGEGDGQAYSRVDALDPLTGLWEALAPLNFPRHGTQAIVSGQGVYVIAGSPNQGGGNQKNMEAYSADAPAGAPSVAGVLSAPNGATISDAGPHAVPVSHASGNQGVFVQSVALTGPDAVDFAIEPPVSGPFLIAAGASRDVFVVYSGTAQAAMASLEISYSNGQSVSVALTSDPVAVAVGSAVRWLLPLLLLGILWRVWPTRSARTS